VNASEVRVTQRRDRVVPPLKGAIDEEVIFEASGDARGMFHYLREFDQHRNGELDDERDSGDER
jgi:hypothetical protein